MTTAIRPFLESDVAFGLELCRIAGWNQLAQDWLRLLRLQPDGLFIAEADGKPCGTASAICHGDQVGWIGMILVHPDLRGRGIGSLLMRACIDFLRPRVRTIKLDATDQGRPVYLKLGFVDERAIWRLSRGEGVPPLRPAGVSPAIGGPSNSAKRQASPLEQGDMQLDGIAFGGDRTPLLKALAAEVNSVSSWQTEFTGGTPMLRFTAFGLARPGFNAWHLGPVVATEPAAGEAVIKGLLKQIPPGKVFWDLLPENRPALELATSLGFEPVRKLTRMYLGQEMFPGRVEQVFAGAGFELG